MYKSVTLQLTIRSFTSSKMLCIQVTRSYTLPCGSKPRADNITISHKHLYFQFKGEKILFEDLAGANVLGFSSGEEIQGSISSVERGEW